MSSLNYNLSPDQRRLIDMYVTQYEQTNTHVERLLDMLDDIRTNIQNVIVSSQPRSSRFNRNYNSRYASPQLNRYINRLLNDNRANSYSQPIYDYNRPINPSIYTNNPINNPNNIFRNNDISSFFSNFLNTTVPVRPTSEQLQNASRIIRYGDIVSPLSETCPISLERFEENDIVRQLIPCGHLFCQSQFQEWFENNVRCPVCRYDIRNYVSSNRNQNNNNNINSVSEQIPVSEPAHTENIPTETSNPVSEDTNETNNPFYNIIRNPDTNEINQIEFELTNTDLTGDIIGNITNRLFQSILYPQTNNQNNDRIVLDASNNILLFEAIIRPNRQQ